jgi:hypothetical protein
MRACGSTQLAIAGLSSGLLIGSPPTKFVTICPLWSRRLAPSRQSSATRQETGEEIWRNLFYDSLGCDGGGRDRLGVSDVARLWLEVQLSGSVQGIAWRCGPVKFAGAGLVQKVRWRDTRAPGNASRYLGTALTANIPSAIKAIPSEVRIRLFPSWRRCGEAIGLSFAPRAFCRFNFCSA